MARNDHCSSGDAQQLYADGHGSMSRRRSARTVWANLLVVAASLVVGFVGLEIALGFTHYRYLTHPPVQFPPDYYVEDPELGADLAPNRPPAPFRMRGPTVDVFTNQWGCFDHDDPVTDDYLLAVGDSQTWGFAALEDKWTTHLEALSGRRVLKCGVSGTGPRHQEIKARKTIARVGVSPAIILVLYDRSNDLNDDVLFPGDAVVDGYRGATFKSLDLRNGRLVRRTPDELETEYRQYLREREAFSLTRYLTEHLTTVAILREALDKLQAPNPAPDQAPILTDPKAYLWQADTARFPWVVEAFEEHLDNLRALRRMADEHGAELVLITDGIPDEGLHRRLRAFIDSEIRYHIDVAEPMAQAAQGQRVRYHHDFHWNPLGNRLAANLIHRYLVEVGLI
jgi:hypothetical protein